MQEGNSLCLHCANLTNLKYLPREDVKLTHKTMKTIKSTVVVEFCPKRKRYERQGILIDSETFRDVAALEW